METGTLDECVRSTIGSEHPRGYYYTYSPKHRTTRSVHRLVYEEAYGKIPEGMCVCHSCDNTWCVNPEHLWLGTHTENMRDKLAKGRANQFRGEQLSYAKLSDKLVIEAKRLKDSGWSLRRIAQQMNVNKSTIGRALTGITWKHLNV